MLDWPEDNCSSQLTTMGSYISGGGQEVELGTIDYVNIDSSGRHGEIEKALAIAKETGKPLFCNYVEWSGWQGCKDAGKIFAQSQIVKAAEELFVPCAFNTWDRYKGNFNEPFKRWSGRLEESWWGYLRIVDCEGKNVIAGTGQLTGYHKYDEVKETIVKALKKLGKEVPDYLQ